MAGDVSQDGLGLDDEGRALLASCDIVIHSATKFIGGDGDGLRGRVVAAATCVSGDGRVARAAAPSRSDHAVLFRVEFSAHCGPTSRRG